MVAVIFAIGLIFSYLAVVSTLCVVRNRSLARSTAFLRILTSWFVPVLGPIFTLRVAAEESPQNLQSRWWLWPLRWLISDESPEPGFARVTDMGADAERILPGSTPGPPP